MMKRREYTVRRTVLLMSANEMKRSAQVIIIKISETELMLRLMESTS